MTWEQRWHPLREEWVIVAAHRDDRPWTGHTVESAKPKAPAYDAKCPLCPGNVRVSGVRNADYADVFVFDNDLPCVGSASPQPPASPHAVFKNARADGLARVVCYDPRHNVHTGGDGDGADPQVARSVARTIRRPRRAAGSRPRPHLREQGRSGGRLESPPALPDLRDELRIQDDYRRGGRLPTALRGDRARPFRGHSRRGTSGRPPHPLRERLRDRVHPLFRAVRVRDVRRPEGMPLVSRRTRAQGT